MDAKRSSQQIDGEMQELRGKIRAMESHRQEKQKAVERAKKQRKSGAFVAYGDGDKKATEQLAKAREAEIKAAMEMEDLESAIDTGRQRFERLEAEWHKALADEAWAELMAEAELARKEAEQIDVHATAMAELLGAHGKRLEGLKRRAHDLGFERVFQTVGLRHFDRTFAWKMIKNGFAGEYEKPSEQYRKAPGYAEILSMQIEAAKNIYEHRDGQANGQDGGGPGAEGNGEAAMEPGTETEAGATATYIQVRPDDPEAPLPGQVWLKSGAQ